MVFRILLFTGLAACLGLAACGGLPEPRLASQVEPTAVTVEPLGPGRYHLLVRVSDFAPAGAAERLLRERAAAVCGGTAPRIEGLTVAAHPALAAAEVTCPEAAGGAAPAGEAAASGEGAGRQEAAPAAPAGD